VQESEINGNPAQSPGTVRGLGLVDTGLPFSELEREIRESAGPREKTTFEYNSKS